MPNPGNRRREKRDVRHECETGYVRQETWERRQDTRYKIQETWIKRQEITARCCCGAKILKVAHIAMEQIKVASDKNWKNGPFKDKKNYLGPTCSCNSAASRRTDCFVKRKCRLNSRSGRVKGSSRMRATRGRYRRGGGGGTFSIAAAWRRWRTTMLLSASMV